MNQLQSMRVYMRVCEAGSFARAATQLNLSKGVVTRHIAMLEAHLNTRLLNRTTRSVSLTEAGSEYLEGCRHTIGAIEAMDANVGKTAHDASGSLRIVERRVVMARALPEAVPSAVSAYSRGN